MCGLEGGALIDPVNYFFFIIVLVTRLKYLLTNEEGEDIVNQ